MLAGPTDPTDGKSGGQTGPNAVGLTKHDTLHAVGQHTEE